MVANRLLQRAVGAACTTFSSMHGETEREGLDQGFFKITMDLYGLFWCRVEVRPSRSLKSRSGGKSLRDQGSST